MRKIKIVADTSCDLFKLNHSEFSYAPMKIITAEKGGVLVGFEKA